MRSLFTGGPVFDSFWITAQEAVFGFLLAAAIGVGFGVIAAESAFGRNVLMPVIVAINAAPKVAFAPIFVAWLGFGLRPKVALAAFIAFFPLLIDTAAGLASVDREQLRLFRSIRASRWITFVYLKLPSALPYVFAGLKTASFSPSSARSSASSSAGATASGRTCGWPATGWPSIGCGRSRSSCRSPATASTGSSR